MSKPKNKKQKPGKPYKNFPMYAHACGQWAKRVRGKLFYFGKWDDPDTALKMWLAVRDELSAGITPTVWDPDLLTVAEAINLAIASKERRADAGELTQRSFDDYHQAGKFVVEVIDRNKPVKHLRPHDFVKLREHLAKRRSVVTLRNLIRRVKVLFNWCEKNGYIQNAQQLWGTEFDQPSERVLRLEKEKSGPRLLSAVRIKKLLIDASPQLMAMILLGINAGYGPADCCRLERRHLKDGWVTMSRGKTGKTRLAKLWPETIRAIRNIEADRELVFQTRHRSPWDSAAICHEFAKLREAGETIGFYWLRHTLLTVGEETKDFEALRAIMGHIDASMSGQYREGVSAERLTAVSDYVRGWLFG